MSRTACGGLMRFGILGPVEAHDDAGSALRIGGPREQRLLATLLLDAGRSVPLHRLAAAMWGDDPPRTARAQVHNSVAALRRNLVGPAGEPAPIVRSGGGFLLGIDPEQLDSWRFGRQVDAAERLGGDRAADAVDLLRSALDLWRGPALSGVESDLLLSQARALDERRLVAQERHLALSLDLGRHDEVLAELTRLTGEHPLRERLVELRMLALYRCGRRPEALELYPQLRRALAEDTGLDPRPELEALHRAVLRCDPELAGPGTAEPVRAGGPPVHRPAELPAEPAGFAGRGEQLAELDRLVADRDRGDRPHAISAIVGPGGIGKTALAVHWAHQRSSWFPDGQIYVDLRGSDAATQLPATQALGRLLRGLGRSDREIAVDPEERAAQYRSILAGRRILVLLDNAASSEQVRPLLPGAGPQTTLITSRTRLDGLTVHEGVRSLTLRRLPADEAAVLVRLAANLPDSTDPAELDTLVELCDGLPLALRIAAARLLCLPGHTLAALIDELRDEEGRLSTLSLPSGDAAVRTVFASSYAGLAPPSARLIRMIGLHPGAAPSLAVCAAAADEPVAVTAALLEDLGARHIVERVAPGRYHLHDLIRLYAQELGAEHDPDSRREAGRTRILSWYLVCAATADLVLRPFRSIPFTTADLGPAPADLPELADEAQVLAWFDDEAANLVAAVAAAELADPRRCWQLAVVLHNWLERRQRRTDWLEVLSIGLRAALADGSAAGEAMTRQLLGVCLSYLGRADEATPLFEAAVALRRGLREDRPLAWALMNLGNRYVQAGRDEEGMARLSESLARLETGPGTDPLLALVLNNLGWAHYRGDRLDAAIGCFERSAALARETGNAQTISFAEGNLGTVYEQRCDPANALVHWQRALRAGRASGDRRLEANSVAGVARARIALGRDADIVPDLRLVLAMFIDLGDEEGVEEIRALLATRTGQAAPGR